MGTPFAWMLQSRDKFLDDQIHSVCQRTEHVSGAENGVQRAENGSEWEQSVERMLKKSFQREWRGERAKSAT